MSEQPGSAPRPEGARFSIGVGLFVLGLACPVFVPLVAASGLPTAWKTTLSGLLVLGLPELLWVAAAAVLGREGFEFLKARLLRALRRQVLAERVSRARYQLGLVLFALPLLVGWLAPYALERLDGYESYRLAVNLTGDALLLSSLVVLGGGFWDKLRAIFIYDAKAVLPEG